MQIKKLPLLIVSILLCEATGIGGSFFTFSAIPTWYVTLTKPSFSPPNWLFGPVWTTLYALMGISLYLIWRKGTMRRGVKEAMLIFLIQLGFNLAWSIIFFGLRRPDIAFIEILVLWALIVATLYKFYRLEKLAAYILIPYLVWVSFAAYLNFSIWQLNP